MFLECIFIMFLKIVSYIGGPDWAETQDINIVNT